jgi:hypothetical protein
VSEPGVMLILSPVSRAAWALELELRPNGEKFFEYRSSRGKLEGRHRNPYTYPQCAFC